jgi:hypothetical protein
LRQARNYGALHDTRREADQQPNEPALTPEETQSRDPRHYGSLHETQQHVDEKQNAQAEPSEERSGRPILRQWTHRGGMAPQQESAMIWHKQNIEIKMAAANDKSGGEQEREGEGSQPNREENDPELQQARAAVEDAKRREAAERARQHEHDRSGPER